MLRDIFYDSSRVVYPRRVATYENRDGSHELRRILNEIRTNRDLFNDIDVNEVFFNMVHFAHAHADQINWAFKTSFLHITGYNESMDQSAVETTDKTTAMLAYIDEVKPYRVKTRGFSRSLSPPISNVTVHATDFDKPVYSDLNSNTFRTLKTVSGADTAILANTLPWKEWYDNYVSNSSLIRRMNATLIYDRIDAAVVTNAVTGETFSLPATTLDRPGHPLDGMVLGAGSRITSSYQPVGEMAEKNLVDLLNLDFRGTIIDGDALSGTLPLDLQVVGSNSSNSISTYMNQNAYQIADPYHGRNRPEELVHISHHDTVYMRVHSNGRPGAPKQTAKFYETSTLNIESIDGHDYYVVPYQEMSQSSEAVAVFRDGLRAIDYQIDHFAREVRIKTVHPNGEPISRIGVHVFGIGGVTKILEQRFYISDGSDQTFEIEDEGEEVEVEVIVNGVRVGGVVGANGIANVDLVTLNNSDQVMLVAREPLANSVSSSVRIFRQDYAYSGSRIFNMTYGTNPLNTPEAVILEVNGLRLTPTVDYTRSGNNLTVGNHIGLTSESQISVTTFRNSNSMSINTTVFAGSVDGTYDLAMPDSAYLWVTVNGKKVIQDAEFAVFDDHLAFQPPHETSDVVVVTRFMGNVCEIGNTFLAASIKPSKNIMTPLGEGDFDTGEYDMGEWDAGGYTSVEVPNLSSPLTEFESPYAGETRNVYSMDGGWEYIRVQESHSGFLDADLSRTAEELVVRKKSQAPDIFNTSIFRLPQPDAPGVIWINGERIEYSRLNDNGSTVTLGGIQRGTKGTKIGDEQRVISRFEGDGSTVEFQLSGANETPFDVFVVDESDVVTPLISGIDYVSSYDENGATIIVQDAPVTGTHILMVQTVANHLHRAGAEVVGSTVRFSPNNRVL